MLLLEAKKASEEWRTGLLMPKPLFDGSLCSEPSPRVVALDDSAETIFEGSLHLLSTEEVTVWRHRASMVADLAAEAKAKKIKGGGWSLEADELGHESFSTDHLFLEFAEADVREGRKQRPQE